MSQQDDRIEQLVDNLEDLFGEHVDGAIEEFFKKPEVMKMARELKAAGLAESVGLWHVPILADIITEDGPVWAWSEESLDDEDPELGEEGDEEDEPEFGDNQDDFSFLKAMHIDRKGIFSHLNKELDEARQERQDEHEALVREEAIAWEEEPDLAEMEDGGGVKKEDTRTIPEIIESAVANALKLNFFQRVYVFYLLRNPGEDMAELRKAGVKFSDTDIAKSLKDVYFKNWIKQTCENISSNEANRIQLLFFEQIVTAMQAISPPDVK